jgi:ribosomal protein S18 acetylase RimI-like enzyme
MVTAADGIAGFYSVGVLPAYQGRGYGETVMRHVARFAATRLNCHQLVLQSSIAGRKLYRRLGFREFTTFTIYHRAYLAPEEQGNGNDFGV